MSTKEEKTPATSPPTDTTTETSAKIRRRRSIRELQLSTFSEISITVKKFLFSSSQKFRITDSRTRIELDPIDEISLFFKVS